LDFEVSFRETEKILFWYRRLRAVAETLTPPSHGGLIEFRGKGGRSRGSQVEEVAILRADLSTVLDAIERFTRSLPEREREIVEARYFKKLTWEQVAKVAHFSKRTCQRKRDRLIPQYSRLLENLGSRKLSRVWHGFDTLFGDDALQA